MIHVVSTMTESRDHMNHVVVSTKPVVSTTCFSQDHMAANLETRPLSRLAVTEPLLFATTQLETIDATFTLSTAPFSAAAGADATTSPARLGGSR